MTRSPGRPRQFEKSEALEAAMNIFWSSGYEGASIDQLSHEMNVPRGTLYKEFGSKEELFIAAIDHYALTRLTPIVSALGPKGSLEEDLQSFFKAVISLATSDEMRRGCLISCVLTDAAGGNERFRNELNKRFKGLEQRLEDRILAAPWNPSLGVPVAAAAAMIAAVARGIMVRARSGTDAKDLRPIAKAAVRGVISFSVS